MTKGKQKVFVETLMITEIMIWYPDMKHQGTLDAANTQKEDLLRAGGK